MHCIQQLVLPTRGARKTSGPLASKNSHHQHISLAFIIIKSLHRFSYTFICVVKTVPTRWITKDTGAMAWLVHNCTSYDYRLTIAIILRVLFFIWMRWSSAKIVFRENGEKCVYFACMHVEDLRVTYETR